MSGVIGVGGGAFGVAPVISQRWVGPRCFSFANSAVAADTLYAHPFIPSETFTCDQAAIRVTTGSAGSAKIGIYTSDDLTGVPDVLVAEVNADLDTTSTATLAAGFDVSPVLTRGRLYFLATCFSATPSPVCWNHAIAQNGGYVWINSAPNASAWLSNGNIPSRVTRTAALTYVASSAFFPATFGASTEGSGSPGAPIVALRKD